MSISPSDAKELLDRSRRIETRLTRYLEAIGFDTKAQRPVWLDGEVHIPSMACATKDILEAIPQGYEDLVKVYHQGQLVLEVFRV